MGRRVIQSLSTGSDLIQVSYFDRLINLDDQSQSNLFLKLSLSLINL